MLLRMVGVRIPSMFPQIITIEVCNLDLPEQWLDAGSDAPSGFRANVPISWPVPCDDSSSNYSEARLIGPYGCGRRSTGGCLKGCYSSAGSVVWRVRPFIHLWRPTLCSCIWMKSGCHQLANVSI